MFSSFPFKYNPWQGDVLSPLLSQSVGPIEQVAYISEALEDARDTSKTESIEICRGKGGGRSEEIAIYLCSPITSIGMKKYRRYWPRGHRGVKMAATSLYYKQPMNTRHSYQAASLLCHLRDPIEITGARPGCTNTNLKCTFTFEHHFTQMESGCPTETTLIYKEASD